MNIFKEAARAIYRTIPTHREKHNIQDSGIQVVTFTDGHKELQVTRLPKYLAHFWCLNAIVKPAQEGAKIGDFGLKQGNKVSLGKTSGTIRFGTSGISVAY
jgi:hypothetical protein